MTLLLVLVLLVLSAVELVRLLRTDDLGHRPPPARRLPSGLPDHPYALR